EERLGFKRIAQDTAMIESEAFARLPPDRRAFVLDLTSDYLRYRSATDEKNAAAYKEQIRTVLTARSALRVKSQETSIPPLSARPEQGHKTSRAGLAAGWR
ncbi:MAG: hypothetical protein C4293_17940, partial [Nitrospiraceae bacterium]